MAHPSYNARPYRPSQPQPQYPTPNPLHPTASSSAGGMTAASTFPTDEEAYDDFTETELREYRDRMKRNSCFTLIQSLFMMAVSIFTLVTIFIALSKVLSFETAFSEEYPSRCSPLFDKAKTTQEQLRNTRVIYEFFLGTAYVRFCTDATQQTVESLMEESMQSTAVNVGCGNFSHCRRDGEGGENCTLQRFATPPVNGNGHLWKWGFSEAPNCEVKFWSLGDHADCQYANVYPFQRAETASLWYVYVLVILLPLVVLGVHIFILIGHERSQHTAYMLQGLLGPFFLIHAICCKGRPPRQSRMEPRLLHVIALVIEKGLSAIPPWLSFRGCDPLDYPLAFALCVVLGVTVLKLIVFWFASQCCQQTETERALEDHEYGSEEYPSSSAQMAESQRKSNAAVASEASSHRTIQVGRR